MKLNKILLLNEMVSIGGVVQQITKASHDGNKSTFYTKDYTIEQDRNTLDIKVFNREALSPSDSIDKG